MRARARWLPGTSLPRLSPESRFVVLSALLLTAELVILAAPGYWAKPAVVAPAVMADLVLGLPAIGYLVLVRAERMRGLGVLPLAVLGLILARWWIPAAHQALLPSPEWVAGLLEVGLVAMMAVRIRRVRARHRAAPEPPPTLDAMRDAATEVFGRRVGEAVFTELAVMWYAVTGWGRRGPTDDDGTRWFTAHRRAGYGAILMAILMMIAPETLVVHVLLARWSVAAAWVATGLAIYSALWLVGDYHAARLNPSSVSRRGLALRLGLRWRADVPWSAVAELTKEAPDARTLKMTLFGRPDAWLVFREPVEVSGLLGIRRRVEAVGVAMDDTDAFGAAVAARGAGGAGGAGPRGPVTEASPD